MGLEFLFSDAIELVPPERTVLEILETVEPTEAVFSAAAISGRRASGSPSTTTSTPRRSFADRIVETVNIYLTLYPVQELAPAVRRLRSYPARLLAEKVETREQLRAASLSGSDYFQGYYFARPSVLERRRPGDSAAILLEVLRLLMQDADTAEIEMARGADLASPTSSSCSSTRSPSACASESGACAMPSRFSAGGRCVAGCSSRFSIRTISAVSTTRCSTPLPCAPPSWRSFPAISARATGGRDRGPGVHGGDSRSSMRSRHVDGRPGEGAQPVRGGRRRAGEEEGPLGDLLTFVESMERLDFESAWKQLEKLNITRQDALAAQWQAFAWRTGPT